jgi:hypothetical protein
MTRLHSALYEVGKERKIQQKTGNGKSATQYTGTQNLLTYNKFSKAIFTIFGFTYVGKLRISFFFNIDCDFQNKAEKINQKEMSTIHKEKSIACLQGGSNKSINLNIPC